ncbi:MULTISPECIES: hypothetical protein [Pseudovibrio]|uniref:Capsule polysaccharide biosynthesis protein n=1 Tax=Pseudovibrio ascidiaceicola TaxID=285279 RepID=A0A1I3VYT5_9HYPH|nr:MULTISPECIES: hypothetical protein [Pseudovibrio]KZL16017.1 hypothetical protein PsAD26_00718 [Pseudovibrio sp. Ad26]SFK00320.1 hypothetical protein SAMN04488518_101708 [Pseudovibrio ascidiaceicola]
MSCLPDNRFSEAYKKFTELERTSGLFDLRVGNVCAWRLVRGELFLSYMRQRDILNDTQRVRVTRMQKLKRKSSKYLRNFKRRVKFPFNLLTATFLTFAPNRKPVLVLAFGRKSIASQRFTLPIEQHYGGSALRLGETSATMFPFPQVDTASIDWISKFFSYSIPEQEIVAFSKLVSETYEIPEENISKLVRHQVSSFAKNKAFFKFLLARKKTHSVYVCWNKHYYALLAACEDLGVPTSEFQHGIIGHYHSQYALPEIASVPYFPDRLLTFGPGWEKEVHLPEDAKMVSVGSTRMQAMLDKHKHIKKQDNLVVAFSQKVISFVLFEFVIETALKRPDLLFQYKMHPFEQPQRLLANYVGRIPENVEVVDKDTSSYALMAKASYVMGVASTTLVESLGFGAKTLVVPFAGWELLESFIHRREMKRIDSPQEAADAFDELEVSETSYESYFSSPDDTNLLQVF